MQISRFTDLGLRVLMYLTQPARATPFTINEMANELMVSHNHLMKVVHFMAKQGWIITIRGKGGGIRLAQSSQEYRLGRTIKTLEQNHTLVDCGTPPCILRNTCTLKSALDSALQVFFDHLDQYTLADMIKMPVQQAFHSKNRIPVLDLMSNLQDINPKSLPTT
ncbi:RrF2 family transcriptional regulator [Alkanindiges sp. WGS2144]|uniref:RrF2 family transcriptional regulator n=1 Tax=Alkanindiges sp. WGS2144 TaxID=3366808 RepID=UPI003750F33D